jgi:hypothetical protein
MGYARIKPEANNMGANRRLNTQIGTDGFGNDQFPVHGQLHSQRSERRQVWRVKCVKITAVDLLRTVAPHELAVKIKANFWNIQMPSDSDGSQKIVLTVVVGLAKRDLRPCEYHTLGQVLKEKTADASAVRHGVGAMNDNECIVGVIVTLDIASNL